MIIQWYPGHMAKTRRLITENLKLVDLVCELVDARIPRSSRNPEIEEIIGNKPRVTVLNKCDMADAEKTKKWLEYFGSAVAVDSISGKGIAEFKTAVDKALVEKRKKDTERGMRERPARLMIVGIPNVGKSSFINKLAKRAGAKTGDRPGVTTAQQWVRIPGGYELLDTPGVLWPKFDDQETGLKLAFTGAIKDDVYDIAEVACILCKRYEKEVCVRYGITPDAELEGHELLFEMGKKRGCLISGGDVDYDRAARILLDEFRGCKLGRITLEEPCDFGERND